MINAVICDAAQNCSTVKIDFEFSGGDPAIVGYIVGVVVTTWLLAVCASSVLKVFK